MSLICLLSMASWSTLAPLAFYMFRYGKHWMHPRGRVFYWHWYCNALVAGLTIAATVADGGHVRFPRIILPFGISFLVLVAASVNILQVEFSCPLAAVLVRLYQLVDLGLIILANALLGKFLWTCPRVPAFAFMAWATYAILAVALLLSAETRVRAQEEAQYRRLSQAE